MKSKKILLNTNSKRIHNLNFSDGRCKIDSMKDEYKVFFESEEEALAYPSKENPLGKLCSFCQNNKRKEKRNEKTI